MATFTVSTDTNYSDLTTPANNDQITINDGATLTIDTSTVDLQQIQIISTAFGTCLINNTSTTTPIIINIGSTGANERLRFEGGGVLRARGALIQIGTGDGTANQVISLPTSDLGENMPNLGGLWSSQGDTLRDTTSIPRLHLQVSDASNACTLEEVREIFTQDTVANEVTMVYPVPNGQPIYMSNIIFDKGATAVEDPFFDLANSGTCDLQYVHITGNWDVNCASASTTTMDHVAIWEARADIGLNNQINAPTITNCVFVGPTSNPTVNLASSANAGTLTNVWADSGKMDNNGFNITNTSNGYFEKVRNTCYRATSNVTSNARGAFYTTGPNHTFYDCTTATGSAIIYAAAGSASITADNLKVMHGCRSTHAQTTGISMVRLQNSSNNTFTRLHHQNPETLGGFNFGSDAIDIDAGVVDCIFDDVIIYAGSAGACNSVINEAGTNNRYNNFTIYGLIQVKCLDFNTASLGAQVSNFTFDQVQTAITNCELGAGTKIDQVGTGRNNNNIATGAIGTGVDCISSLFYDFDDTSKTTGRWHTRMSPTVNETDYYTEITKTGAIVFNNNNQLYMTQSGDQIELESRVHYNITGSDGGYGTAGTNVSNFTIEFALRRPEGTYTTYRSPDAANFNASLGELAADTQNRVQIKWRITRDVSNATDNIQYLYFDVTLSGDDYPFITFQPTFTAPTLADGYRVRLYNVTQAAELDNALVSGGAGYSYQATSGVDENDEIRLEYIFKDGVTATLCSSATAIATGTSVSFVTPIVQDEAYNTNAIDGSTVTTITADYPNVQIDINDADGVADVREIYAWYVDNLMTEQGIRDWCGAITAIDALNFRVNTSKASITIQNTSSVPIVLSVARIYRDDGATILSAEVGDQPMTQDNGELVQFIQPQVSSALSTYDVATEANLDTKASQASVDSIPTSVPTASQNADAVWSKTLP